MISVIVCSCLPTENNLHYRNIKKTIGAEFEYIRIDNTQNNYSICQAYNLGVSKSSGEIIVFLHEDVFFLKEKWGNVLINKFITNKKLGILGVAGTQYLSELNPLWTYAGRPFIKGRVIHQVNDKFFLTIYNKETTDSPAVAVDGLFMTFRKEVFNKISFDDNIFDGFHFYDLDICMQLKDSYDIIVTNDIVLKHCSKGTFDSNWVKYSKLFIIKHKYILPATCSKITPVFPPIDTFENVDLKGRVSQEIIV